MFVKLKINFFILCMWVGISEAIRSLLTILVSLSQVEEYTLINKTMLDMNIMNLILMFKNVFNNSIKANMSTIVENNTNKPNILDK